MHYDGAQIGRCTESQTSVVQFCKIVHRTHLSDYLPTSTVGSLSYRMASLSVLGIHPILCKLYCQVLGHTQLGNTSPDNRFLAVGGKHGKIMIGLKSISHHCQDCVPMDYGRSE